MRQQWTSFAQLNRLPHLIFHLHIDNMTQPFHTNEKKAREYEIPLSDTPQRRELFKCFPIP